MAFGQPAGPPATRRQLDELLGLLNGAGHVDFRDARGPMGFNQRQAGGRFTRDEADAFITELTEQAEMAEQVEMTAVSAAEPDNAAAPAPPARRRPAAVSVADRRQTALVRDIKRIPSEVLAAELQRRGWAVIEP